MLVPPIDSSQFALCRLAIVRLCMVPPIYFGANSGATHRLRPVFACQFACWCHPSTPAGFCLPVRVTTQIDATQSQIHFGATHRLKPECACHFRFPRKLMPLSIRGLCHSTTKAHFKVSQSAERHLSIHAVWNFCFCMCGKP